MAKGLKREGMIKTAIPLILIFGIHDSGSPDFDHGHTIWNNLVSLHVHWISGGNASQVDYKAFKKERSSLSGYLNILSNVSESTFNTWPPNQRLAFLINTYNAFTVDLILTKYPDLKSIKDLGTLFSSPWKKNFFSLFGKPASLDQIEHEMIRGSGKYDDPRIHFVLVCAAIGCPGLRKDAVTAEELDDQLENSLRRFLSDKSRNRYNFTKETLEVSKIFKWYKKDFETFGGNENSLKSFLAKYADLLASSEQNRTRIAGRHVQIKYLDYDWGLNDVP